MDIGKQISSIIKVEDADGKKIELELGTSEGVTMLVGANGTGKTIKLVNSYIMQSLVNSIISNRNDDNVVTQTHLIMDAQFMFDGCFERNKFSGVFGCSYNRGKIKVFVEKGRVEKVDYQIDLKVNIMTKPVFLSKGMRLWDSVNQYIALRNMILPTHNPIDQDTTVKIMEVYKIYDIQYVETLLEIFRTRKQIDITPRFVQAFKSMTGEEKPFDYLYLRDNKVWCGRNEQSDFMITSYGAGHQSVITMTLMQIVN